MRPIKYTSRPKDGSLISTSCVENTRWRQSTAAVTTSLLKWSLLTCDKATCSDPIHYILFFPDAHTPITVGWFRLWCLTPLQQYFSYIVVFSFIAGGNRSTRRKPPTNCKSLTNFITQCCIAWVVLELTTLMVLIAQVVVNSTTIRWRPRRSLSYHNTIFNPPNVLFLFLF